MTNKVSFIIQFKDKFKKTATDLDRQFKKIDRSTTAVGRQFKKMDHNAASVGRQFKKVDHNAALVGRQFKIMDRNTASADRQFRKIDRNAALVGRQFKKIVHNVTTAGLRIKKMSAQSSSSIKRLATTAKVQFAKMSVAIRKVNFSNIEDGAKRANDRLKELGKRGENIRKIGKGIAGAGLAATAAVTLPAVLIGKSLVTAASDATETANKFNVVFEGIKNSANTATDKFAKNFGVAGSAARKMIGNTGDLLVGLGFTEKKTLDTSIALAKLGADLTSFSNFAGGATEATRILTRGVLGQTESLDTLGVFIRRDTKEWKDRLKFIQRSRRVTLQQAQTIAILSEIVKQSKKSVGDVARTWEDYASVVRRAGQKNMDLKETYGKHLLPLATLMVEKYEELADVLIGLSPATQRFILALTGIVAIGGPVLLILGGLIVAFGFLSSTALIVVGVFAAVAVAGALLIANWRSIKSSIMEIIDAVGDAFTALWEGRFIDSIKLAVNAGILILSKLFAPLRLMSSLLTLAGVKIPLFNVGGPQTLAANDATAPIAPIRSANGTISGQITVAAAPGSEVKSTKLTSKGSGLNVGMNMRAL